ncbi:GNAT family N-acetyltransferase [Microbacterium sp. J1-1]|uniref:GNAT family N-acetyltransferase n=1 Tax=Microbacterium sp. J1-1 TaxID=2992441 RepID=UPI0021156AE6|nr:GNAT family N-acetyltransferase [Microbacterium sp. J1-1]UUE19373.1 GNAT family N-acetyltransferase [Microbacterium sp. J1-1]
MMTWTPAYPEITISSFTGPEDALAFRLLNEAWISRLFTLTDEDRRVLEQPVEHIIRPGGDVLLARAEGTREIVGCVALLSYGDGVFELAKMAVTPSAQGSGLGHRLVASALARASELSGRRVFLGTSTRLSAAVHIYEAAGFRRITRSELPVEDYYARADTLMEIGVTPLAA